MPVEIQDEVKGRMAFSNSGDPVMDTKRHHTITRGMIDTAWPYKGQEYVTFRDPITGSKCPGHFNLANFKLEEPAE